MAETQTQPVPPSPSRPHNPSSTTTHELLLSDPLRTTPIHPSLQDIKLPSPSSSTTTTTDPSSSEASTTSPKLYQYHPITCEPLTPADLQQQKLQQLRKQYPNVDAAQAALEEAVREVKGRLDEAEQKRREVDAELDKLEKTHKMEMRVIQSMNKGRKGAG